MKQVMLEIWMENRNPIYFWSKVLLVFCLLFEGVILSGYPYTVMWSLLSFSLEGMAFRAGSQIEYLVPRTGAEYRKIVIAKCVLRAGFYSLITSLGYVLMICFCNKYSWDMESVIFVVVMTVLMFMGHLMFRLNLANSSGRGGVASLNTQAQKSWRNHVFSGGVWLTATLFLLFSFICRKFAGIKWFVFFGNKQWIAEIILVLIISKELFGFVRKEIKEISFEEYCG